MDSRGEAERGRVGRCIGNEDRPRGNISPPGASGAQSRAWVTALSGRLGNIFSALRLRLARKAGVNTGLARGELAVLVDVAKDDRAVVDLEETVVGLANSNRFTDQRLAEE